MSWLKPLFDEFGVAGSQPLPIDQEADSSLGFWASDAGRPESAGAPGKIEIRCEAEFAWEALESPFSISAKGVLEFMDAEARLLDRFEFDPSCLQGAGQDEAAFVAIASSPAALEWLGLARNSSAEQVGQFIGGAFELGVEPPAFAALGWARLKEPQGEQAEARLCLMAGWTAKGGSIEWRKGCSIWIHQKGMEPTFAPIDESMARQAMATGSGSVKAIVEASCEARMSLRNALPELGPMIEAMEIQRSINRNATAKPTKKKKNRL